MNSLSLLTKVMARTGWLSTAEIQRVFVLHRRGLRAKEIAKVLRPRNL